MRKRNRFKALIVICVVLFISIMTTLHAQESDTTDTTSLSLNRVKDDSIIVQDGPYVFWIENHAVVQYVCGDEAITRRYDVRDSLNIQGLCGDSSKTLSISSSLPAVEPDTFVGATKICAISDIHGNFDQMIKLLQGNGVVDDHLRWRWGDGHLVIVGDIFDRGPQMTEALWFIHQLEKEALKAGGKVHFVLGNHEIMVLRGDERYVNKKYKEVSRKLRIKIQDLYGPETELGRWLRAKNVFIKINDILFVHGGISPDLIKHGYSIQSINRKFRNSLDARDYTIRFDEELELLYRYKGPVWYRGYIHAWKGLPRANEEEVASVLDFYKARAVVIGHTIINEISSYYSGRVFAIETGIHEGAKGEALIWEGDHFYRADIHGQLQLLK